MTRMLIRVLDNSTGSVSRSASTMSPKIDVVPLLWNKMKAIHPFSPPFASRRVVSTVHCVRHSDQDKTIF